MLWSKYGPRWQQAPTRFMQTSFGACADRYLHLALTKRDIYLESILKKPFSIRSAKADGEFEDSIVRSLVNGMYDA